MSYKAHIERSVILVAGLLSLAALTGCGGSQAGANRTATSSRTSTTTVAVASVTRGAGTRTVKTTSSDGKSALRQGVATSTTRTGTAAASQTSVTTTTQTSSASSAASARHLSASALRAVLATYVSCLRAHGVNLPQPNRTGRGPVVSAKGVDPKSPTFKRANALCEPGAKAALHAAEEHAAGR